MTCEELIDFIAAWREGSLPADVKQSFERHLSHCPCCDKYLDKYLKTAALAEHLNRCTESSAPCPEHLVQAILAARRAAEPR